LIIPCSVRGITVEAHCNPIMEVNTLPWLSAETLLGNVPLAHPTYSSRAVSWDTFLNVGGLQELCHSSLTRSRLA
jgi:hypothetical protein